MPSLRATSRRVYPLPVLTFAVCFAALAVYALAASGRPLPWVTGQGPVVPSNPLHLVGLGARSTPLVADAGEGWRLLTCHFVHTSWLHLWCNLLFVFSVGGALEQVSRRGDYAAVLGLSAVGSSLCSLLVTPQVSAGASGLVFGLMGAAVAVGWRHPDQLGERVRRYFGWWLLPFLVVIMAMTVSNPMVDHASHLGGLLGGVIAALGLRLRVPSYRDPTPWAAPMAGLAVVLMVLAAPALARDGTGPRRIATETGVTLQIPGAWQGRYGVHGEREYVTAGGMVVLTTGRVPSDVRTTPPQWYARHRLVVVDPASRAEIEEAPETQLQVAGLQLWGARYRLVLGDVPMVRRVYFVRDPTGQRPITVISLQTPVTWAHKYDETLRRVVGSVRVSGGPLRGYPISTAALQ